MAQIPCVEDSCSIDLQITNQNKLKGDVILDPNGGLSCGESGLYIKIHPSSCNDVFLDNGQLRSNKYQYKHVVFTTNGGNPAIAGLVNQPFGTFSVDVDAFYAAYGNTPRTDIAINGVGQLTNDTCRRMLVELSYSIIPGYFLGNGWYVWVGAYQDRNYPAGGFSSEAPFVAYDHTLSPFNPGTGLGGDFHPRTYTMGGLILDPGQTITATIGASLQVVNAGFSTPFGNSVQWRLGCTGTISAWTVS
jgi:hypothetical protein